MTDEYAYQASEALETAVREALARVDHWERTVLLPWQDEHGDVAPLWVRKSHGTGADKRCVGFADSHPNRAAPDGLSRSQKRRELIPARGAAGDPWRDLLDRFNTRPSVGDAFALHGVELAVLDVDAHRLRWPAILISTHPGETGLWMRYAGLAPRPTEHLTAIPVSAWHLADEAMAAREQARRIDRETADLRAPVEA